MRIKKFDTLKFTVWANITVRYATVDYTVLLDAKTLNRVGRVNYLL
jgi:hypothetical protein